MSISHPNNDPAVLLRSVHNEVLNMHNNETKHVDPLRCLTGLDTRRTLMIANTHTNSINYSGNCLRAQCGPIKDIFLNNETD